MLGFHRHVPQELVGYHIGTYCCRKRPAKAVTTRISLKNPQNLSKSHKISFISLPKGFKIILESLKRLKQLESCGTSDRPPARAPSSCASLSSSASWTPSRSRRTGSRAPHPCAGHEMSRTPYEKPKKTFENLSEIFVSPAFGTRSRNWSMESDLSGSGSPAASVPRRLRTSPSTWTC